MRSLFIALVLGIILSSACSGGRDKGILSEKEMTRLMTEVHLLDGYLSMLPIDSSRKIIDPLYAQLFARYGLDSSSFEQNVTYYYASPERTERIYNQIEKALTAQDKEIMRLDSIRSAKQRDSTSRVRRYTNLLNMQRGLFRVYHSMDADLNISEYNSRLYRSSGLGHLWQSGMNRIPSRASTARPPEPYAHIPESIRLDKDTLPDSIPAFEVYREMLYQAKGLSRLWPKKVEQPKESEPSDSETESTVETGGVEEENRLEDNETAL